MNKSQLFKQAHKLAKAIILKGDCYRTTFGACLKLIKSKLIKKDSKVAIDCKHLFVTTTLFFITQIVGLSFFVMTAA